jgi:hypothetical protein
MQLEKKLQLRNSNATELQLFKKALQLSCNCNVVLLTGANKSERIDAIALLQKAKTLARGVSGYD